VLHPRLCYERGSASEPTTFPVALFGAYGRTKI
jgi:hypothetical protein